MYYAYVMGNEMERIKELLIELLPATSSIDFLEKLSSVEANTPEKEIISHKRERDQDDEILKEHAESSGRDISDICPIYTLA